jgi:hypothetical protein
MEVLFTEKKCYCLQVGNRFREKLKNVPRFVDRKAKLLRFLSSRCSGYIHVRISRSLRKPLLYAYMYCCLKRTSENRTFLSCGDNSNSFLVLLRKILRKKKKKKKNEQLKSFKRFYILPESNFRDGRLSWRFRRCQRKTLR